MQTINKQPPGPECLVLAKASANQVGFVWPPPGQGCSDDVRARLVAEQHGLCAYCQQRIKATGDKMKIEHVRPRSVKPYDEEMYDWSNLLGVCLGQTLQAGKVVDHCDAAKGAQLLNHHPANSSHGIEDRFVYRRMPPNGSPPPYPGVWIHGVTTEAAADVTVLRLNAEPLVRNRHRAVDQLRRRLAKANKSQATRLLTSTRAAATNPNGGELPPFARLLREEAEKRLRQRS